MFVLDDIVELDDRSTQKMLRELEMEELSMALKKAPEGVTQKILINMSQRAAGLLKEDIANLTDFTQDDIDKAQEYIVSVLKRLHEQGDIILPRGSGD